MAWKEEGEPQVQGSPKDKPCSASVSRNSCSGQGGKEVGARALIGPVLCGVGLQEQGGWRGQGYSIASAPPAC